MGKILENAEALLNCIIECSNNRSVMKGTYDLRLDFLF